jgi:hypothetical protein
MFYSRFYGRIVTRGSRNRVSYLNPFEMRKPLKKPGFSPQGRALLHRPYKNPEARKPLKKLGFSPQGRARGHRPYRNRVSYLNPFQARKPLKKPGFSPQGRARGHRPYRNRV